MTPRRLFILGVVLGFCLVNGHEVQSPILHGAGQVDDCHNTCIALVEALGNTKAFYGVLPDGFRESYFSARQREVTPACVMQPSSAQDVSTAISIINKLSCHFAVKSGGHAMFAGASNANGGITIDLRYLNGVELSEDHATASVGPGNKWGDVYKVLEPRGLTVAGGRVTTVGVGGFMLGGGISFLSRLHGWASDNVRNYEVVLANGSVSNINYKSHPDLFWALRGGGSNFGVVTRFDLETYSQGPVWGGTSLYVFSDNLGGQVYPMSEKLAPVTAVTKRSPSYPLKLYLTEMVGRLGVRIACFVGRCTTTDKFFEAVVKMARKGEQEEDIPYMHLYATFAYMPQFDFLGGATCMIHSKPNAHPPEFKDFEAVKPAVDGGKIRNLTHLMAEIDPWTPPGVRTMFAQFTFRADKEYLSNVLEIFIKIVCPIKHIPGLFSGFVLQPIAQIARANRHKNGGNPFGINEADGALVILNIFPQWKNAEDDVTVQMIFRSFLDRAIALAKERELFHPFVYQNYANISQDPFAGYGEENRQKLRDIQAKYDPERMFTKLQPGYHQL